MRKLHHVTGRERLAFGQPAVSDQARFEPAHLGIQPSRSFAQPHVVRKSRTRRTRGMMGGQPVTVEGFGDRQADCGLLVVALERKSSPRRRFDSLDLFRKLLLTYSLEQIESRSGKMGPAVGILWIGLNSVLKVADCLSQVRLSSPALRLDAC